LAFFLALSILLCSSAARAESTTTEEPAAGEVTKHQGDETPKAKRDTHYVRLSAELAAVIGVGTAWYWLDRERQIPDWDYPTWKEKATFDVMIFDNNPFRVNYIWHAWSGGALHLLGRTNGLGPWASTLMGLLTSLVWEYGIEAREQISINDLLVTNTTGLALGEFAYRLGQYFHSKPEGFGWDIGRYTVGLPQFAHDEIDGVNSALVDPTVWADLDFSYGFSVTDAYQPDGVGGNLDNKVSQHHTLGMAASVVHLDGYRQPGLRTAWLNQVNFSEFRLSFTEGGGSATDAYVDAIIFGWRRQNLPAEGEDRIGTGLNLGTSMAYTYHREQFGNWQDRLGGLHWPGIAVDGELLGSNWQLTGSLRGSVDYMGVSSLSNKQWHEMYSFPGIDEPITEPGQEIGKQILRDQGYWLGWGPSLRMRTAFESQRFGVGGSLFLASYDSHEGRDRRQEQISIDQKGAKTISDYELWVRARLLDSAYLKLRGTYHRRNDSLEQFTNESEMSRVFLELGTQL
jgi:hypothetical protein